MDLSRKRRSILHAGWWHVLALALILSWAEWGGVSEHLISGKASLPAAVAAPPEIESIWPHEVSDLEPDPALTFGRLANGFRYVVMSNKRPGNRVSLHLFIRAGSLHETDDQQGLAHFLEHMLFNGSTHFPPGELIRYFQSIGMQFGNDANAHTGFDETVYDVVLPGGDRDNLKKGLLVMSDYASGALLLEEEVQREKGVILAEMRTRDSAGYRIFKETLKFEIPQTRIPRRMPIGQAQRIQTANRNALKTFYDTWYRPDNMILVMVGDMSTTLAVELIESRFSQFSTRCTPPVKQPEIGHINHKGLKVFYHHEPETGGTTVSIEVVRKNDLQPDSRTLQRRRMLEAMADQIVQYRLDTHLKSPGVPFTSAAIGSGVYLGRIRYAEITADTDAADWRPTLETIEQVLRRAKRHGFSAAELDRAKKDMLKQLDDAVHEAPTRDSTSLARQIIGRLARNRVFQSPQQERDHLTPVVAGTTVEDLNRVFCDNWPDDHRLVLVSGDANLVAAGKKDPEIAIRDAFLASAGRTVEPPPQKNLGEFPYLPVPKQSGAIASRETLEDLEITRVQFENGIRLNVKQTDYKANEVLANLVFGAGKSSEPENLPGLSLLAATTINESGLAKMAADELEQKLAGTSTDVEFLIDSARFRLAGESVTDEIELLFQLLYAYLMDPGYRDEALKLSKQRLHQRYLSALRSIEGRLQMDGRRFLAGGDSRFGMPRFSLIEPITLDDIRGWVGPQLEHAPLELSIVGDVKIQEVIDLAGRYLGTLPVRPGTDAGHTRSKGPVVPAGQTKRIHVRTRIPKAMVVMAWQTDDFWEIHRTRRLSVLSDVFSERLRQRIRERLGASYSPYAFNDASRAYTGYGVFQAHIGIAPDQVHMALQEVQSIAHDLAGKPIDNDELARAVGPILNSIKVLRQTNGYWLNSVMTGSARHSQQYDWARSLLGDYAAVTAAELKALAAKYLIDERSAAVIVIPDEGDDDKDPISARHAVVEK